MNTEALEQAVRDVTARLLKEADEARKRAGDA